MISFCARGLQCPASTWVTDTFPGLSKEESDDSCENIKKGIIIIDNLSVFIALTDSLGSATDHELWHMTGMKGLSWLWEKGRLKWRWSDGREWHGSICGVSLCLFSGHTSASYSIWSTEQNPSYIGDCVLLTHSRGTIRSRIKATVKSSLPSGSLGKQILNMTVVFVMLDLLKIKGALQ